MSIGPAEGAALAAIALGLSGLAWIHASSMRARRITREYELWELLQVAIGAALAGLVDEEYAGDLRRMAGPCPHCGKPWGQAPQGEAANQPDPEVPHV